MYSISEPYNKGLEYRKYYSVHLENTFSMRLLSSYFPVHPSYTSKGKSYNHENYPSPNISPCPMHIIPILDQTKEENRQACGDTNTRPKPANLFAFHFVFPSSLID